ncbi:hypothetical protein M9H77_08598 [Catharanthus roseus]|uniref:Uncharacterized protein n=1 Tax=Catharanthus roseus TaxID=4058 RepID=A0ACC0BY75_CATRO|nr:hypothetical protein M9H77_08598 [Catharanthus roseus]
MKGQLPVDMLMIKGQARMTSLQQIKPKQSRREHRTRVWKLRKWSQGHRRCRSHYRRVDISGGVEATAVERDVPREIEAATEHVDVSIKVEAAGEVDVPEGVDAIAG